MNLKNLKLLLTFAVMLSVSLAAYAAHKDDIRRVASEGIKELEIGGEYELDYKFVDGDFQDNPDDEESFIEHELDIAFKLGLGEGVTAEGSMEYADGTFGNAGDDHALGDDNNVDVEEAFINVAFEALEFTGGKFNFALPWAFDHSPVLDDEGTGMALGLGSVTLGWLRAADFTEMTDDKADVLMVMANLKSGGMKLEPYAVCELLGQDSGDEREGYWIGAALEMKAGSLGIEADAVWGRRDHRDPAATEAEGWMADAKVSVKMAGVEPNIFVLYSTADDDNADESETLPTISGDFEPFLLFEDSYSGNGSITDGVLMVGGGLDGISFIPGLEHDLVVAYIEGDGDEAVTANTSLNHEDSDALEIDFKNSIKMKDGMVQLYLDLAWAQGDFEGIDDDENLAFAELGMEVEF